MVDLKQLVDQFIKLYGVKPRVFSAPGRVNIIGEHTDYNDGFVLPMAINRRTYIAIAPREGQRLRVSSVVLHDAVEFSIDEPTDLTAHKWAVYVAGVAWTLKSRGLLLGGADILIDSDVPIGAGLSSSAALEVTSGTAFAAIANIQIDSKELALAAQQAEHQFVGAKVGIMDQFAATFGHKNYALLIDCRSLEMKQIPLANLRAAIVVCDTKVKHDLASSAYNQRRAECERGVELLRQSLPGISALRDVSAADFAKHESELPDTVRRRCRHIVTENDRTLEAAQALRSGDRELLGELMRQSHESLKTDYEVSCRELDVMVEIASRENGGFGARMTGGGFGGCTINLVELDAVESFTRTVSEKYRAATNIEPEMYVISADDGAREETM